MGTFRSLLLKIGVFALVAAMGFSASAPTVFKATSMRRAVSPADARLIERGVDLIFDDDAATIRVDMRRVGALAGPDETVFSDIAAPFDDIAKVVIESRNQPNGIVAYWFYFERKPAGFSNRFLLRADGQTAVQIAEKVRNVFGSRVVEPKFGPPASLAAGALPAGIQCPYRAHANKPLPEVRPGQALIVVVCPRTHGTQDRVGGGAQFDIFADGRQVGANREGTYSFVYLDPGEHLIASRQKTKAYGTHVRVDAGEGYYFFQDPALGGALARRSRELAMFEAAGSYQSGSDCSNAEAAVGMELVATAAGALAMAGGGAISPQDSGSGLSQIGKDSSYPTIGAAIGVNTNSPLHLFFEANVSPAPSSDVSRFRENIGTGVQVRFRKPQSKTAPYVLGVVGGALGHLTIPPSPGRNGVDETRASVYFGFGGGFRYYVGRHWGIRPEFRAQAHSGTPIKAPKGLGMFTLGVFYQVN